MRARLHACFKRGPHTYVAFTGVRSYDIDWMPHHEYVSSSSPPVALRSVIKTKSPHVVSMRAGPALTTIWPIPFLVCDWSKLLKQSARVSQARNRCVLGLVYCRVGLHLGEVVRQRTHAKRCVVPFWLVA